MNTASAISLMVGTVLPLVVGFVSKENWNPGVKAGILAALSGASSVLSNWLEAVNNNQHFNWTQVVLAAFLTWGVGELTYLKVWKASGITDTLQGAKGITSVVPSDLDYDGALATVVKDQPLDSSIDHAPTHADPQ